MRRNSLTHPRAAGRSLRDRLGSSHGLMDHHGKVLGEPSLLVDLAFSHPDGFEATHTKSQQEAQRWLFDRCRRLPSKLRQECVQRLASAAAQSHSGTLNRMARLDIVSTLALNKRQTYLVEVAVPAAQEAEELASATAAAGADGALQALLKRPEVADAMAAIANDPEALARYDPHDPKHEKIFEALNLLNMHASGADA